MKKIVTIFLLVTLPIVAFSQNVKLTGVVKNSKGEPLEMANVIAFKKGTQFLQSYSITDSKGNYKLSLEENMNFTLKVSYLGFETKNVDIKVDNSGKELTLNIELSEASESLGEVEISYEMPVKIVGDTIVYNADSFKTGTEKKLEDVLAKLPGVEIDDNGEVEVEGKKVQKVLVEGKEFFDGDTKLATQNIPANAIDKVQVLKNYNEVSGMRNVTNNEDNIALNIKLKSGKDRFWFGDVTAGGGEADSEEKYLVKPKLFYYSPEKSASVLADFNNIGEAPFTMRDYFRFTGGLRSMMRGGGTSFNVSSGVSGLMGMQSNRSVENISKFGAANFSLSPKKSLDINGFGIINKSETEMYTESNTIFNKSGLVEVGTSSVNQESTLGMLKLSTTYTPNTNLHIDYDIFGKTTDQNQFTDVESSNRGAVDTYKEENPFTLNQNFNAYYTMNEKNVFSAELQHMYEKDEPLYNSLATTQPFEIIPSEQTNPQDIVNLLQNKKLTTSKFDAKLDYFYLLTPKSNINVSFGTTFSSQNLESGISQNLNEGGTINFSNSNLINDADYNFSDVFLGLNYKMVSGIFTFNPGLSLHYYSTKDNQFGSTIKNDFVKVLPDVYAKLQFKSSQSLRFNYSITSEFSDVSKIAEGYILNSYNSLSRGNRELENALYHKYSLNFFSFSMFSFTNINASVNYTKKVDGVKNNTELIGVDRISYPINSNFADETLSASFRYGKTYNWLKTNARANWNRSIFNNLVNDEQIESENFTHNYQGSLETKFKNAPNIEIGYQKSFSDYSNTGSTTDRPFTKIEIPFLKNFIFSSEYSHYNYENDEGTVKNKYSFLDAELFYQAKDSKWEFSLSGKNLTDNISMNTDSYNEIADSNSTSLYFIQPRLLMFKVKYQI